VTDRLHFISGLPRSGSTLLAAILKQNPAITSGMTTPLCQLIRRLVHEMSTNGPFTDGQRDRILESVFVSYYDSANCAVDTNRGWTSHMPLIARLWPDARVICCVRNLGWIVNSIERAIAANPVQASNIFNCRIDSTVYERAEQLMGIKGMVGRTYASLKEAWFGPHADKLIIVDYDRFVASPRLTLAVLYERCGWPEYKHDFEKLEYSADAFDASLHTPGLHRVSGAIHESRRQLDIPLDLFDKYKDSDFWLNPDYNVRQVEVIGESAALKAVS